MISAGALELDPVPGRICTGLLEWLWRVRRASGAACGAVALWARARARAAHSFFAATGRAGAAICSDPAPGQGTGVQRAGKCSDCRARTVLRTPHTRWAPRVAPQPGSGAAELPARARPTARCLRGLQNCAPRRVCATTATTAALADCAPRDASRTGCAYMSRVCRARVAPRGAEGPVQGCVHSALGDGLCPAAPPGARAACGVR